MRTPISSSSPLALLVGAALLAGCVSPASSPEPAPADPRGASPAVEAARRFREAHGAAILADFAELLRIPNVASDLVNIRRNAEAIQSRLAARGVRTALWELDGVPPIVFGRLDAPGADRTIGIYVHYDGQPVDPTRWLQSPWEPTLYTREPSAGGTRRALPEPGEPIDPEWRLYARAAGDDKAPIAALCAALDALEAAGISRTVNVVFFFEGEEEAGSPNLARYLDLHAAELDVDAWLICDGPVHASRRPQLVFGVRGIVGLEITVYGALRSLHSGHYGNWAPNPGMLLAQLLASMKDADGNVLVEGFHDGNAPLGARERAAIAATPDVDASLREELGLARTEGDGQTLAERLLLPSLNVRGLESASVGASARNVIPNRATASLDLRLVRGNDPTVQCELVEEHVRRQGFHVVREDPDRATRLRHARIAKVTRRGGYPAARTPMDAWIVAPLVEAAWSAAGEEPVLVPSLGGSLPLYLFTERNEAPLIVLPIANHDDNQHAPDEHIRIANLWYGIDLFAAVLTMEP